MGYGTPDPYYQPDKFGLEMVGEVEWSDGCYQFDLTAVWRHRETGQLYYADDSGCSCPSPFEWCSLEDLTPCTFMELVEHLDDRLYEGREGQQSDVTEILGRIVKLEDAAYDSAAA